MFRILVFLRHNIRCHHCILISCIFHTQTMTAINNKLKLGDKYLYTFAFIVHKGETAVHALNVGLCKSPVFCSMVILAHLFSQINLSQNLWLQIRNYFNTLCLCNIHTNPFTNISAIASIRVLETHNEAHLQF